MTKPNRLGMYADLIPILDAALAAGGGSFECETPNAAIHWRHRVYRFRKLYAETVDPNSRYDSLLLRKLEPGDTVVKIEIRKAPGKFIPAGPIEAAAKPVDNDLLSAAEQIAAKIDKGDIV